MSETDDHVSLTRLQAAYADVMVRRAWAELIDLFLADAVIHIDTLGGDPTDLVGPEQLGEFIAGAVERFEFFEYVPLNVRTSLATGRDTDRAAARVLMCEVRRDVGTGEWSTAFGVYHDRYRREEGRWWFARRDYQSLTRTDGPVFPFPHHLGLE
jgi:hypothetical protein